MPTVTYTATLNGNPISAGWSVDRGDLGSVAAGPASTTTFTPTGTTGGLVNVIAGLNGMTLSRQVFIQLTGSQNGSNPGNPAEATQIPSMLAQLTAGGGVGGVGGEGIGPAVSDMPTLAALGAPAGNGQAQGLTFLYPYDKTVFPQGLLAPLLMWSWSTGDADAVQIGLKTASGSFSWTGTFGRPPILAQTGGKFIRMPIPQDVWTIATNTAGGKTPSGMPDTLTVSLTVAKSGMAYGPISALASMRARASTIAVGWIPGRSGAGGCSSVAIRANSACALGVINAATGQAAALRGSSTTATARVAASWDVRRGLARKLTAPGPADCSGATWSTTR